MGWQVRALEPEQHLAYVKSLPSASFLQCPSWAAVKSDWQGQSLGWFSSQGHLGGVGLVLYRTIPHLGHRLAYLPEGPLIDWDSSELGTWLQPLATYLRQQRVFGVRMGPPVVQRVWQSGQIKAALAETDSSTRDIDQLPPEAQSETARAVSSALSQLGWQAPESSKLHSSGFSAGQPRYVFQLPLAGKTEQQVLAGFNQQWRRNIKKAEASQVVVERTDASHLPIFHQLYTETAARDRFTPRPLAYFQRMATHLGAEDPHRFGLYIASREAVPLAAAISVTVGQHCWYTYGASSTEGRQYRPSNALQWRMIRDALHQGAAVYDLRGITNTLDPNDPLLGLLQFKLGTGGQVKQYLGEWELPLHRLLHTAFTVYLSARTKRRHSATGASA